MNINDGININNIITLVILIVLLQVVNNYCINNYCCNNIWNFQGAAPIFSLAKPWEKWWLSPRKNDEHLPW